MRTTLNPAKKSLSLFGSPSETKHQTPKRYLESLLAKMSREHAKATGDEPFQRPGLPTLAQLLGGRRRCSSFSKDALTGTTTHRQASEVNRRIVLPTEQDLRLALANPC